MYSLFCAVPEIEFLAPATFIATHRSLKWLKEHSETAELFGGEITNYDRMTHVHSITARTCLYLRERIIKAGGYARCSRKSET